MSLNVVAGCHLLLLPILPLHMASYWVRHAPLVEGVLLLSLSPSPRRGHRKGVWTGPALPQQGQTRQGLSLSQ